MLSDALAMIAPKTILVVGDLILDRYVLGQSKRISPEAPVPVVLVDREEARAGGAGNVALNLCALGMHAKVVGRVGNDPAGRQLTDLLCRSGVDTAGVIAEDSFMTPVKSRVIASSQQLVRIDQEKFSLLSQDTERQLLGSFERLASDVSLIAISDYAKGTLSATLLQAVIAFATKRALPVLTDPKDVNFNKYAGSTILKPNATETLRAAPPHAASSVEAAARALVRSLDIGALLVTRSEKGVSLFYPNGEEHHFPVKAREVIDTTGAGDTVLAVLSAAYASGVPIDEAIELSNIAASCSIERLGCAHVSLQDIAQRLLETNPSGKVCCGKLFSQLLPRLQKEKILFIRVNNGPTISPDQLASLPNIFKQHPGLKPIICLSNPVHDDRLLQLLASLASTHLIVHDLEEALRPPIPGALVVEL